MNKCVRLGFLIIVGSLLATSALPAKAADISFESRTYLPARGTDESTHVLLYEYVALGVEDALLPGFFLQAGGWARTDLFDETFGRTSNDELQYAFLGWRAPRLDAEVRAGRIALTSGVARNEVFDGLLLGSDLPAGFDLTLFGGLPVEVDGNGRSKDALYGGRVSQGRAGVYRLGLSYLEERDAGISVREEAGSDVFLAPVPLVQITGTSLYDRIDSAWSRHDYRFVLGPIARRIRLTASWASTDYRLFFRAPNNPAFIPRREEKLDRIGSRIDLALGLGFTLSGGYTAYQYEVSGDAHAIEARIDWAGSAGTAGCGYRQMSGASTSDRYQQVSVFATRVFGPVRFSAGAERLEYEAPINGIDSATTGTLGLSVVAGRAFELSALAEYGESPEFEREVKGMFTVLWRYDAVTKKGDAGQ